MMFRSGVPFDAAFATLNVQPVFVSRQSAYSGRTLLTAASNAVSADSSPVTDSSFFARSVRAGSPRNLRLMNAGSSSSTCASGASNSRSPRHSRANPSR